jgi:HAE1 family hydrophobic/amphiphilic exporter-1
MFVDTFIKRPILASVCSLVIVLAGALSVPSLPVAQFPDLAPPQVQVIAVYNGASALTVVHDHDHVRHLAGPRYGGD